MKTTTILSLSLMVGLLGTAVNATDPSQCKSFHVKNDGWYDLQPEYYACGTKEHKTPRLHKGQEGTYSVEPETKVWAELGLAGTTSTHIWPKSAPNLAIGDGLNLTCSGLAMDPLCQSTPMQPTNCKTFHVKNDMWSGTIMQSEYVECQTKDWVKVPLHSGEDTTYFVEPGTTVRLEVRTEVSGTINAWPDHPIGNGQNVVCTGSLYYPKCTATQGQSVVPLH